MNKNNSRVVVSGLSIKVLTWEDAWGGTRARCDEQRQGQTNTHTEVHRGGSHREVINNSQTQV